MAIRSLRFLAPTPTMLFFRQFVLASRSHVQYKHRTANDFIARAYGISAEWRFNSCFIGYRRMNRYGTRSPREADSVYRRARQAQDGVSPNLSDQRPPERKHRRTQLAHCSNGDHSCRVFQRRNRLDESSQDGIDTR